MAELDKNKLREAARSIREHNLIHIRKEPRAIYITQYLEFAASLFEKIADGKLTEQRRGEWIQQESPNGRHYNCSRCGHEFCVPCSEMIDPRDHKAYLDEYCGGCGAKMGGADNG